MVRHTSETKLSIVIVSQTEGNQKSAWQRIRRQKMQLEHAMLHPQAVDKNQLVTFYCNLTENSKKKKKRINERIVQFGSRIFLEENIDVHRARKEDDDTR